MESFDQLDEIQQAALLVSAKTRLFCEEIEHKDKEAATLAIAHQMAENPEVVERVTTAYVARKQRSKDPLSVLGSLGF